MVFGGAIWGLRLAGSDPAGGDAVAGVKVLDLAGRRSGRADYTAATEDLMGPIIQRMRIEKKND